MSTLSDKIWVTRKARIYAEKRLNNKAVTSQTLMTFYSVLLLSLSIWNITYSEHQQVNIILVFSSLAVLISSILLASQKFTERSIAMRNCYIKLDELYWKVKRAEEAQNADAIRQFESEYAAVLLNIENHTDYDYLNLRYSLRNDDKTTLLSFSWSDYLIFSWGKSWRISVTLICFLLPMVLAFLWSLIAKNVSIN